MSQMRRLLEAVDSMSKVADKPTGPKFPGYWKGDMPAAKARDKMVGGCEESILKTLSKAAKDNKIVRKLKEDFAEFQKDTEVNPTDTIKVDVPLLIRIMEYAREDAKDDMDLHRMAERLVQLSQDGNTLGMKDYDQLVQQEQQVDEYGNAQNPNAQTTTPGANGSAQADNNNDDQSKTTDAAMQKNVNLLKTLNPKLNTQMATQAMAKTDIPGAPMTGTDINQSKQLVGLLEPALGDPTIGPQVTALLRKAGQAEKTKRV